MIVARVEQLAKALEGRGFDVWWDPELLPGEQYAQKISKGPDRRESGAGGLVERLDRAALGAGRGRRRAATGCVLVRC